MNLQQGATASRVRVVNGVPSIVVTVLTAVVMAGVSVVLMPPNFWLVVALLVGGLAIGVPRSNAAWAWMLIVAAAVLAEPPGLDGRAAIALLGIHLVHVLASMSLVVPLKGRIEARVLGGLVPGFLAIQLPSQLLLAGCLFVLGQRAEVDALPLLAPVGAAAVLAVIALLVARLRSSAPR